MVLSWTSFLIVKMSGFLVDFKGRKSRVLEVIDNLPEI